MFIYYCYQTVISVLLLGKFLSLVIITLYINVRLIKSKTCKYLTKLSYKIFHWSFCVINVLRISLKLGKSSSLHNSSHDLGGSHVVGFECGLSKPIPPVSRNLHSSSLTSLLCFWMLTQSKNENSSCRKRDIIQFNSNDISLIKFVWLQYFDRFILSGRNFTYELP